MIPRSLSTFSTDPKRSITIGISPALSETVAARSMASRSEESSCPQVTGIPGHSDMISSLTAVSWDGFLTEKNPDTAIDLTESASSFKEALRPARSSGACSLPFVSCPPDISITLSVPNLSPLTARSTCSLS